jgi:hypothetical protein
MSIKKQLLTTVIELDVHNIFLYTMFELVLVLNENYINTYLC